MEQKKKKKRSANGLPFDFEALAVGAPTSLGPHTHARWLILRAGFSGSWVGGWRVQGGGRQRPISKERKERRSAAAPRRASPRTGGREALPEREKRKRATVIPSPHTLSFFKTQVLIAGKDIKATQFKVGLGGKNSKTVAIG